MTGWNEQRTRRGDEGYMKNSQMLLDWKIANEFHAQAKKLEEYPLDYGAMTTLKKELMELCGVTELEALNILCRRNVPDYINKYTGIAEGRVIQVKKYTGEVQVVFQINEDERDIFE